MTDHNTTDLPQSHLKTWCWVSALCLCVSSLLMLSFDQGWLDVSWQKRLIYQGDYWRVLSGHWLHLSWNHWLMNQLGLVLILWLLPMLLLKARWLLGFVGIGLVIGISLLATDLDGYVGMSGVLYGLLFYGALIDHSLPKRIKALFLTLVAMKVLVEQVWPQLNAATEAQIGGMVAIDAHLFGSLAGVGMALLELTYGRLRARNSSTTDSKAPNNSNNQREAD
ncbi:rhombosortase [Litoribrevibacter euphylliae]